MADVKWIKITTDIFDNRKIKHLRKLPQGDSIVLIWIMLLTIAGRCNDKGKIYLTENIPYTPKMLADELGYQETIVSLALQTFEQFDMVEINDTFYTIKGWEEYQNEGGLERIREQNRKRVAKHRANQKLLECNVTGNATVTQCNAIEEEREKEKEEEYHSFIHSAKNDDEFLDEDERRAALLSQQRTALDGPLGGGVVLLSDEQIKDLLEKLSLDEFHHYIGIIRDCELKGKSYKKKTHYQAIIDMAIKDRKVK